MLQQTQVDRVVPKFTAFIARFPDIKRLAVASQADVLRAWQGLGYNSRAVRLHAAARAVMERHGGVIPVDRELLLTLPGIGPYTVGAIRAFAYDFPDAAIDTNLRRVVHRLVFGVELPMQISRAKLDEQVRSMVPPDQGHDWNSALMDLGATLCTARAPQCRMCPLATVCAAAPVDAAELERLRCKYSRPQSIQNAVPFEQSTRYARGRIIDRLRALAPQHAISFLDLHHELCSIEAITQQSQLEIVLQALERDGLIEENRHRYRLKE